MNSRKRVPSMAASCRSARLSIRTARSGMDCEYIRDRTLEGNESARARGKAIGGATVTDEAMLAVVAGRAERARVARTFVGAVIGPAAEVTGPIAGVPGALLARAPVLG